MGGIIVWPKDSDPSTSSNIWLECNGQTFDTNKYKKLYKVLGSNKVPNFQGMFLRGAGSQEFKQNNGQFSSESTTYSAGSVGSIQGDGMRRLWGIAGPFQFTTPNGINSTISGNFVKESGLSKYGSPWSDYDLGQGDSVGIRDWMKVPYMEYTVSGSAESGYSLNSRIRFFDQEYQSLDETSDSNTSAWGTRTTGWDSAWGAPTANEIRPVNMAVKYYIRAK